MESVLFMIVPIVIAACFAFLRVADVSVAPDSQKLAKQVEQEVVRAAIRS